MRYLLHEIRISIVATLVFCLLFCIIYPLAVWGIGQALFPSQANGSLITDSKGQVIGSRLLAQGFTLPKYFHPRPSSAGTGYDSLNSGGSNLGPTSQKLSDTIKGNIAGYRTENNLAANAEVPADAVTASASGLDPHISIQNAQIQAARVAKARSIDISVVQDLIEKNTDPRGLGFLGEPGVNVLALNVALDQAAPVK
jgi:potassium-transporting ATPase KdpC subunit